ncbi:MAG: biotin transporter BioY [Clostridia bacterium]|nr:MAG: biotin transporter BioY [Clostridia bacterium]
MSTRWMVLAALFAALIAVLAQLAIPLPGGVPFTMQLFGVFLTGSLLGGRWGAVAMLVYLLLGAAGMPVFSNGHGGLGWLLGPTGGFLIGFLLGVYVQGKIVEGALKRRPSQPASGEEGGAARLVGEKIPLPSFWRFLGAMIPCLLISYAVGTLQFSLVNRMPVPVSLGMTVLPFVPFDAVKMVVAAAVARGAWAALVAEGLLPLGQQARS